MTRSSGAGVVEAPRHTPGSMNTNSDRGNFDQDPEKDGDVEEAKNETKKKKRKKMKEKTGEKKTNK